MSEQIVQVTPQGEIIGPIDRDQAHDNFILHAVALIFLFSPKDESQSIQTGIFQIRSLEKKQYPGYLSSAAAGHITYEEGKTLEQLATETAQKELRQEIGIDVPLVLFAQGFLAIPNEEQQFMFIYVGRTDEIPTQLQQDEVSGVKLLTVEEFFTLAQEGKVTPFALEALKLIGAIT